MFSTKVRCSKHDCFSEHTVRHLVNWLSRVGVPPITPAYGNGSSFQNTVLKKLKTMGSIQNNSHFYLK